MGDLWKAMRGWLGVIAGVTGAAALIGLLILGSGAVIAGAGNASFSVAATGVLGVIVTLVASAAAGILVAFGLWLFRRQLVEKRQPFYPEVLAAVFAVPLGAVLTEIYENRLQGTVAAVVLAALCCGASHVLQWRALAGLLVYLCIAAAVAVAAFASERDVADWIAALGLNDWLALGCLMLMVIGVPAAVAAIEANSSRRFEWAGGLARIARTIRPERNDPNPNRKTD
jgi:hypothetical protein